VSIQKGGYILCFPGTFNFRFNDIWFTTTETQNYMKICRIGISSIHACQFLIDELLSGKN
jgi:hypothetical protein